MFKLQRPFYRCPPYLVLGLLVVLGFGLRLWFLSLGLPTPQFSSADDGDYYQRALRFATTGQYIDDFWLIRSPLHVFFFAFLLKISIILGNIDGVFLIQVVQSGLFALLIPVGYALAKHLFNPKAGLIFAVFLTFWFPLIELPAYLLSENLYLFLWLVHLWLFVWWSRKRNWYLLALSGVLLGLASLTRSPLFNSVAFIGLFFFLEAFEKPKTQQVESKNKALALLLKKFGQNFALFLLPCLLVILPWTVRNYILYQQFILLDTISSVNLWLHLADYEEQSTSILKKMPQAERQPFAVADTKRMFQADPGAFWKRLWRNAALHFRHIWKAQFIEDFIQKGSFNGRPLREVWFLGALSDLLWFLCTLTGLAALTAPLREGHFRWLILGWIGYNILAMLIMHIEPRYLLPIWLPLMLYSAWFLSDLRGMFQLFQQHKAHSFLLLLVTSSFLFAVFTYRDYPSMVRRAIKRENHFNTGFRAYEKENYALAIQEFQQMVAVQSGFSPSRAMLALAFLAQGQVEEAKNALRKSNSQWPIIAQAAIARELGESRKAKDLFKIAEEKAGENVQKTTLHWLRPQKTTHLSFGNNLDLGYLEGFSLAESISRPDNQIQTYRWLESKGKIVLPLPKSLQKGNVLALSLANNQRKSTNLRIQWSNGESLSIPILSNEDRVYRLPIPTALVGQNRLAIDLEAPVFMPAHIDSASKDTRLLSLMVYQISIE